MNTVISFKTMRNICSRQELSFFTFKNQKNKHPLSILTQISLYIFIFNLISFNGFAQTTTVPYLTDKDTLFLSLNDNTGEKSINHTLKQGQTLYSLARFYGLNEEELYSYNPTLKSNKLPLGQIVHVPIPNPAIKRFKGDNFKRWKFAPIMFVVKKKDNLYKIAKTLFHMPIDSVVKWNKLPDQTIKPGQLLHVGWMSVEGVPDSIRSLRKGAIDTRGKALADKFTKQKSTVEQRGAAFWQKSGNQNTDLYCLHRSAKIGSTISITNGMNNRNVYAKVIGKLPDNIYGNEIIIIVSPSAARLLGAKDDKFFVKIKYQP
jgi:LysM repeat protein